MVNSKNILVYLLVTIVLFIAGTVVVAIVKPKMHQTFNIQKLIIKKEVIQK